MDARETTEVVLGLLVAHKRGEMYELNRTAIETLVSLSHSAGEFEAVMRSLRKHCEPSNIDIQFQDDKVRIAT